MVYTNGNLQNAKGLRGRLSILSVLVIMLFGVLLIRLWQLQIVENEKYRTLSENNRVRTLPLKSPRGYIKDRNGELLVENRPEFKLYVIPEDVPDIKDLLAKIEGNINIDVEPLKKRLAASKKFKPVLVKGGLSRNELGYLEEHRPDLPGTFLQVEPVRFYRYGPLAAHLLGYLGEISLKELNNGARKGYLPGDYTGKSGLEKIYEDLLRGRKGHKLVEVDSLGRELRVLGDAEPLMGDSVTLTIDLKLQLLAEDLLDKERGAIMVMDPRDGQVLAYVSKPVFDPNLFASGLRRRDWIELSRDEAHPLQDRVTQGQYPPGSVFKIVTAVAALEEGIIDTETTIYCAATIASGDVPTGTGRGRDTAR
jgi:penicillin-binding protein 2